MSGLARRRAVAVLSLAGVFLSAYLVLHRMGFYGGGLLCGAGGGCDLVQASRWAVFLGIPVAGWGLGWYASVFLASLVTAHERFADARWPDRTLLVLATGGLAFTAYLTGLELFVIGAICRWCVASALLVLAIFALTLPWGGRSPERVQAPDPGRAPDRDQAAVQNPSSASPSAEARSLSKARFRI